MNPNKFVTHGKTKVVVGSIITPELGSLRLVLAPCGLTGKPDTELHVVLDKKWKQAKAELKGWYSDQFDYKLGNVRTTAVQSDTWLVHALILDKEGKVDLKALQTCVKKTAALAKAEKASVHVSTLTTTAIPELGDLLAKEMIEKGTSVFFYQEADQVEKESE